MKKTFTILIATLMLLTMISQPTRLWGQEKTETTTTYVFQDKDWKAKIGTTDANWTCGKAGAGFANNGIQVTNNASYTGANGTTPISFTNVTKIVATYNTNKSAGSGTIVAQIGSNDGVSKEWAYSGSSDGRTANFTVQWDYATPQTGNVKITCNTTTNSIYLVKVAITTSSGSSGETTTTTITDEGITNTNKYVSTAAGSLSASVTYGNSATPVPSATVTWSGDDDDVATIDSNTGAVTLIGAGTVNFTATYEGATGFNSSYANYEMTVTDENPALTTIWSEDFSSYSADAVPSGGTYSYSCVNGNSDTKVYNEQLAGGDKPELLVGKSGGSFTATIPLLTLTYGYSGDLKLKFKTNNTNIAVSSGTTGITVSGTIVSGDNTITLSGVTTSTESVEIVFANSNSSNVRLDNIVLKGEQAALTKVATPNIAPASGAVASGTVVTITCATEGASIYYTTNGDTPTSSNTLYNPASKPTITAPTTIKAIAVKDGLTDSNVASAYYTIALPCATPTFSVAAGEVDKGTTVTISTETDGATIYYTTDGTNPTTSSSTYSSAITINSAMTIKAIAVKEGNANSAIASAAYTIKDYATLPFNWDNTTTPTGITTGNTGGFYGGSPYIKLNQTGTGVVILKLNAAPGIIAFDIKGNPSSGTYSSGTFTVAISADGENYTTIATYTTIVNKIQTMYFTNLNDDTRYIKWSYAKVSGNVALGKFNIQGIANQSATITPESNHIYVVNSGATMILDGDYSGILNNADNLIIEDGGELITHNAVQATLKKNVEQTNDWGTLHQYTSDQWYFIASPVNGATFPTGDANSQDLYQLDWTQQQWLNLQITGHSSLLGAGFQRGTGYLYASKEGTTLVVAGEIQPLSNSNNATVTLANDGWNLIGNPLTCKVTVDKAFGELNNAAAVTYKDPGNTINPYQGIAVYGGEGDEVTFTKAASQNAAAPSNNASLQMTLSQTVTTRGAESSKVIDNAVVSFNNNSGMPKFNMIGGNAKLYIPQNGEDYAIAFSNRQGDMLLNFKTTEAGMYTISFEGDNMDLKGVSLIDMLAEEEIDLSVDPSYTFIGSPADKAERFKIVFSPSTGSGADIFAYQSGSDIIVSGEGELQIFDVMGRRVKTQYVSGVQTVNVNAQGVYIMKLNEKTQKIIVR